MSTYWVRCNECKEYIKVVEDGVMYRLDDGIVLAGVKGQPYLCLECAERVLTREIRRRDDDYMQETVNPYFDREAGHE